MLKTVIKKDMYKDSVALMLLNNKVNALPTVNIASIMMATPANKDMFKESGLLTEEVEKAGANDIAIVVDIDNESDLDDIIALIDEELAASEKSSAMSGTQEATSLPEALEILPDANLALISVPGIYAYSVGRRCLEQNLNLFIFSDNVPLDEEIKLKEEGRKKGLLVMGPDCGTGIIKGVPLAFANQAKKGKIGIVGASGTGIQEVTCILDGEGYGITHAIGTGGRDLAEEIGAITFLKGIEILADDIDTEVILVLSKPPAKEVREKVENYLKSIDKPVASLFLGEEPDCHYEGYYRAGTLEELALLGIDLLEGREPVVMKNESEVKDAEGTIKGLYTGGTLATEAALQIERALGAGEELIHEEGYMLKHDGFEVIDLGDDKYTQGKPHPMIDPTARLPYIKAAAEDESTKVIILDVVLGFGANEDPAATLIDTIKEVKEARPDITVITTICGTQQDPQNIDEQEAKLLEAGALVFKSNRKALDYALGLIGKEVDYKAKEVLPLEKQAVELDLGEKNNLLNEKLQIINIGLESFGTNLESFDAKYVQYNFKPIAGGKKELMDALEFLEGWEAEDDSYDYKTIAEANRAVADRVVKSNPILTRVRPGKEFIPELKEKVLLHAGPPMKYENMSEPMQGSCAGAVLFEGWAENEEEAFKMLENGEITFIPCHHVNAVGPMGGITSMSMALVEVEDTINGTVGYCTMNEGIGKVLRFGAYDQEVVDRLKWMAEVLGPVLDLAIQELGGLSLNPLIAKAIAMGDEFHQRNIAASLAFLKEVAPTIVALDIDGQKKYEVIKFLADTDQFFLNLAMAAGKAVMDGARKIQEGTIVTAMCRNGENFGIRIAGMGDEWFTAPVNTPNGLYFTGYSEDDANPDMGDSAITETLGIGGMVMIAAPAVTRFVGTGGFEDALKISNNMQKIVIGNNPNFIIPTWNFKGAPLGVDAMKVVETGITPVINTGIASKKAGIGQVGAGTVNPPIECFEKAILAYMEKLQKDEE